MIYQRKREFAIAWLGPRYVLHRSRRVQKLRQSNQQDIHKADVAATFRKIARQLEKEASREGV